MDVRPQTQEESEPGYTPMGKGQYKKIIEEQLKLMLKELEED